MHCGEQNLILLSSSVVNQCLYCIVAHTRGAKQNGIPSKTLNAYFSPEQVMDVIVSLKVMSNYIKHVTENIIPLLKFIKNRYYDIDQCEHIKCNLSLIYY
ncbi:carboxymuconolactone decarboxylase family protein [Formosa sp. L2A11]|uniref:carboxymuconolactone decarboxylase family protein n=1 Tax=Formosa sp. L2A11 TaxID=2686363 RepID=UPI00351AB910